MDRSSSTCHLVAVCPSLPLVELQPAVGLDDQDADVEGRQPGGVHPVVLVHEAALEHRGHHPADEGVLGQHGQHRQPLVMRHDAASCCIVKAFSQVLVLHLVAGEEREMTSLDPAAELQAQY